MTRALEMEQFHYSLSIGVINIFNKRNYIPLIAEMHLKNKSTITPPTAAACTEGKAGNARVAEGCCGKTKFYQHNTISSSEQGIFQALHLCKCIFKHTIHLFHIVAQHILFHSGELHPAPRIPAKAERIWFVQPGEEQAPG